MDHKIAIYMLKVPPPNADRWVKPLK